MTALTALPELLSTGSHTAHACLGPSQWMRLRRWIEACLLPLPEPPAHACNLLPMFCLSCDCRFVAVPPCPDRADGAVPGKPVAPAGWHRAQRPALLPGHVWIPWAAVLDRHVSRIRDYKGRHNPWPTACVVGWTVGPAGLRAGRRVQCTRLALAPERRIACLLGPHARVPGAGMPGASGCQSSLLAPPRVRQRPSCLSSAVWLP